MERSTDERNLERDERQQLSQCLDQFRVSAEKSKKKLLAFLDINNQEQLTDF